MKLFWGHEDSFLTVVSSVHHLINAREVGDRLISVRAGVPWHTGGVYFCASPLPSSPKQWAPGAWDRLRGSGQTHACSYHLIHTRSGLRHKKKCQKRWQLAHVYSRTTEMASPLAARSPATRILAGNLGSMLKGLGNIFLMEKHLSYEERR